MSPARETRGPRSAGKYAITLADLEATAHVPVEEQVAEQPEEAAPAVLSETEVDRQTFLRIAGAP